MMTRLKIPCAFIDFDELNLITFCSTFLPQEWYFSNPIDDKTSTKIFHQDDQTRDFIWRMPI